MQSDLPHSKCKEMNFKNLHDPANSAIAQNNYISICVLSITCIYWVSIWVLYRSIHHVLVPRRSVTQGFNNGT